MADQPILGMDFNALLEANRQMEDDLYARQQADLAEIAGRGKERLNAAGEIAANTYRSMGSPSDSQPKISNNNLAYGEYLKIKDEYNKVKARYGQASPYSTYFFKERGLDVAKPPDAFATMEEESQRKMRDVALGAQRDKERKARQQAFDDNAAAVKKKNQQESHRRLWNELQNEINNWWNQMDATVKRDNLFGRWGPPAELVKSWRDRAQALGMQIPAWATSQNDYKSENPQTPRTPWPTYDGAGGESFGQSETEFRSQYGQYGGASARDQSGNSVGSNSEQRDDQNNTVNGWTPEYGGY